MDHLKVHSLQFTGPVINSSCPWASSKEHLSALFESKHTGGVTTRTATLLGFAEDPSLHGVVFTDIATLNTFGYSPHPLRDYITWVKELMQDDSSCKPIIISITSSTPAELADMVGLIQALREDLQDGTKGFSRIGIELNTSCPNIPNKPPPSYDLPTLMPLLKVLAAAAKADPTLTIGLKLPPYVIPTQFEAVVDAVAKVDQADPDQPAFAFFTCTNTLGGCLIGGQQVGLEAEWALGGYGGMAGQSLHALSLGNVHRFSYALSNHPSPAWREIAIIGVGGVSDAGGVKRMQAAGARIVGLATALGRHGVQVFETLAA